MLTAAGVSVLADVRTYPSSRRHPQFDRRALDRSLAAAGIAYRHLPALGGRREVQVLDRPSPNGAWAEAAFRNYADYALTPAFRDGLAGLMTLAERGPVAMMCAEADWRQCHRRIVTDHLLAAGQTVVHLTAPDVQEIAELSPDATVEMSGAVTYPPRQGDLF